MADETREITITIRAKNETEAGAKASAAAVKAFGKEATDATKSWNDQLLQANKLLGLFGVGLSVAGLVQFGRSVLDAGDQIQKMADQTGLSIEEVQRLQYVAGQSGSSIESLVGAVQNLQQRLGDENSGAAGAMAKLGIKADAFNKLSTYQQMITLASAIQAIKDPTEQASVAAAIFGKTWKEIIPAIKAGMKDVGDQAPVMSDATVQSLDRIGDTLKGAQQQATAWGGSFVVAVEGVGFALGDLFSKFDPAHFGVATSEILRMQAALNDPTGLSKALEKVPPIAKVTGESLKSIAISASQAKLAEMDLTASVELSIPIHRAAEEAAKKLSEEHKKTVEMLHKLESEWVGLHDAVGGVYNQDVALLLQHVALNKSLDDIEKNTWSVHFATKGLSEGLGQLGTIVQETGPDIQHQFVGPLQEGRRAAKDLGREALTTGEQIQRGFGDVAGILDHIPGKFAEITSVVARTGQAIMKNLADGSVWGAVVAGVTGVITVITKLFHGVSAEEKKGREDILAYEKQLASMLTATQKAEAGGQQWAMTTIAVRDAYLATGRTAAEAEAAVQKLWASSKLGAEATKQAIDEVNAVMDEQAADHKRAVDIVTEYGIAIDQLGPKWRATEMGTTAKGFMNDFRVMVDVLGIDAPQALTLMKDKVNAFVQSAIATGTEVPAAMRPMLQRMADMGLLTDAGGEKITDLSAAGVSFATTMTQEFDRLIAKLNEIFGITDTSVTTMETGLETSFTKVGTHATTIFGNIRTSIDQIPRSIDIDFNGRFNAPDTGDWDVPGHARGGVFSQPHLARIAEGGRQEIVGDVDFMTNALAAALARVSPQGGSVNAVAAGSSDRAPIVVQLVLDSRVIDERTVDVTQRGIADGKIRMQSRGVVGRIG